MDQHDPPELSKALLKWINSFDLPRKILKWSDLQDGQVLWKILGEIEPDYFSGELPESYSTAADNWIPRWQNLKYINRAVTTYIRDECGKLPELSKRLEPDLKAIAIDASAEDSSQMLKATLLAAMYSPVSNQKMIEVMGVLGQEVAIPIATWIGQVEQLDRKLAEADGQMDTSSDADGMLSPDRTTSPQPQGVRRDPELAQEEQLIHAYTTINQQRERITELSHEVKASKDETKKLDDELTELKYHMEKGGMLTASAEEIERLRQSSHQDKDTIAELESELESYRSAAENAERQLERLQGDESSKQSLRDELQLLKAERDDLIQKSKANENLKKKIQTLQDSDKSAQTLRTDLDAAEEELKKLRPAKEQVANLRRANDELMKTVQNGEQQIFDYTTHRKRMEHELKTYAQKLEAMKDKQQRDADVINEQEERIKELESGQSKAVTEMDNLDTEVSSKEGLQDRLKARLAELETENTKLKQGQEKQEQNSKQQKDLEVAQARCEELEKQCLDVSRDNVGLTETMKDQKIDIASSKPYLQLRERLRDETSKLENAEKRAFEAETFLATVRTQLEDNRSKLSAIDKDKTSAIDELQRGRDAGNEVLESENRRLAQYVKTAQVERENTKGLLRHSLLDRAQLQREDPEFRAKNEYKLVMEQLKQVQENSCTLEDAALALAQRIDESREDVKRVEVEAGKTQADLEGQMDALKSRLKKAEEEALKGSKSPVQANLERELALMTSAWYDIATRIQSDAVVMQRRGEAPRSFLNRQRRLVSNPIAAAHRRR